MGPDARAGPARPHLSPNGRGRRGVVSRASWIESLRRPETLVGRRTHADRDLLPQYDQVSGIAELPPHDAGAHHLADAPARAGPRHDRAGGQRVRPGPVLLL